jgi:A/G-specific adenine glycosylase
LLNQIVQPLLDWYATNARVLPWRNDPTPYRVLVSELMLQQTRVQAALPYFERFVEELPDIEALARADESKLYKLWEGLGYYSRARNLQKAAQVVVSEYGGVIPRTYEELVRLPGIGPYTAGAVASIAYGVLLPAVDGNVLRVISRLTASFDTISDPKTKQAMEKSIAAILPVEGVGAFNQSLMELGAGICLPGEPKCGLCPVQAVCEGYRLGVAAQLPVKSPKPKRKTEDRTVFVLVWNNCLALLKFPQKGLLADLWGLPAASGAIGEEQAIQQLKEWGLSASVLQPLSPAKHVFTHIEWHMQGYYAEINAQPLQNSFVWASTEDLDSVYSIPSAFRVYLGEYRRINNNTR